MEVCGAGFLHGRHAVVLLRGMVGIGHTGMSAPAQDFQVALRSTTETRRTDQFKYRGGIQHLSPGDTGMARTASPNVHSSAERDLTGRHLRCEILARRPRYQRHRRLILETWRAHPLLSRIPRVIIMHTRSHALNRASAPSSSCGLHGRAPYESLNTHRQIATLD